MSDRSSTLTLPPELDPHGRGPGGADQDASKLATILLAALSAGVLVISGLGYVGIGHYLGKVKHQDVGVTTKNAPINNVAQTFLIVGSDNRAGLTKAQINKLHVGHATATNAGGQRSDTMLLVHISKKRDEVTVVSLPRDSLVTVPRWKDKAGKWHAASQQKLNAAFSVRRRSAGHQDHRAGHGRHDQPLRRGQLRRLRQDGRRRRHRLRLQPDRRHRQGLRPEAPQGSEHPELHRGHGVRPCKARLRDPGPRAHRPPAAVPRCTVQRGDAEEHPVEPGQAQQVPGCRALVGHRGQPPELGGLLALGTRMHSVAANNLQFVTVPIANNNYSAPGLGSTVKWDDTKAHLLFSRLQADQPINPSTASASSSGAPSSRPPCSRPRSRSRCATAPRPRGWRARRVTRWPLVGFAMGAPGNWTSTDVTQTQIYYDPKYDESVKTVQAALPGAKLVPAAGRGATMLVVVGTDYKSVTKPVITVKASTGASASASQDIKARTAADNPCT